MIQHILNDKKNDMKKFFKMHLVWKPITAKMELKNIFQNLKNQFFQNYLKSVALTDKANSSCSEGSNEIISTNYNPRLFHHPLLSFQFSFTRCFLDVFRPFFLLSSATQITALVGNWSSPILCMLLFLISSYQMLNETKPQLNEIWILKRSLSKIEFHFR